MESSENNDALTDQELNSLLPLWEIPPAPPRLRATVFPKREPWWKVVWTSSVRIPAPLAGALAILCLFALWATFNMASHGAYVREPGARVTSGYEFELRPVADLKPRIIRRNDVQN